MSDEVQAQAFPSTPVDTTDYAAAVAEGFYGDRTDPYPDTLYAVTGGAAGQVPPRLTACQPTTGPLAGGTTLNLGGSGLTGVAVVAVGSKQCSAVVVVDDTKVTAKTPPGEGTGLTVSLANAKGRADLAGVFAYQ